MPRNRLDLLARYRRPSVMLAQRRVGNLIALSDSYDLRGSLGSSDGYLGAGGGLAYTQVAGTWATTGNVLTPTGSSPGGNGWYAVIDPGVLLHHMEVTLAAISGTTSGPCVRWTDASNHYQLIVSTSSIQLYDFAAAAVRGTNATGTFAAGDVLAVDVNGSTINYTVRRAGVQISTNGTYGSASANSAATAIAFRATSTSTKYDNLGVWRLAA